MYYRIKSPLSLRTLHNKSRHFEPAQINNSMSLRENVLLYHRTIRASTELLGQEDPVAGRRRVGDEPALQVDADDVVSGDGHGRPHGKGTIRTKSARCSSWRSENIEVGTHVLTPVETASYSQLYAI